MALSRKKRQKKSPYWKNLRKVSQALDIPIKVLRRDFSGQSDKLQHVATRERIATSYKAFKRSTRIEQLQVELRTDEEHAKIYYETIEKVGKDRIERVYFKSLDKIPKPLKEKYGKAALQQFARQIRRGKNKDKWVVFIDTSFDLPLAQQAAELLKAENRTARIARDLLEFPWGQYRFFHKFFPQVDLDSIRKRIPKTPTFPEALRLAELIEVNLGQRKAFDKYLEIFGHSP